MTEKERFFYLQYLYSVLRVHDKEILAHFMDDSISDNDYFFYGINSDIISNAICILTNYLSGNLKSAGVDLCCRAIIEAFCILHMNAKKKITDTQKTIYRYIYAYVDLDNFHSFKEFINKDDPRMKTLFSDKEKATSAMLEHFKCKLSDLNNISIDDPCFFLKSKLDDNIGFTKLLELYPINIEKKYHLYNLFSIFIHPRVEMDPKAEDGIIAFRNNYIDIIINYVYDYLKECKLLINLEDLKDINDFNQDFFYNPILQNNVVNIQNIEAIFKILIDNICKYNDGYDWFTWHFLERSKYLIIDMTIAESLGYREHVIATFKSFIEEYSIYKEIGSINDLNEFNIHKKAFWCSSRLQFYELLQKMGGEKITNMENDLVGLYLAYYMKKYNITNYDDYKSNMINNSLYFLDKEKKSYNKYVKKLIKETFTNELQSKDVMTLYKLSKDMTHASGYSFNATIELLDVSYHKVMLYTWMLLEHFIFYTSITLKAHRKECDFSNVINIIETFKDWENQTIENLYNEMKENQNNQQ